MILIKQKKDQEKIFSKIFLERENSIISKLFYSEIVNIFRCKCNFESYGFQKILDIPLLIPGNIKKISVENLIKINFNKEYVDFNQKCVKCNKVEKHTKEIKFVDFPTILILSIQR